MTFAFIGTTEIVIILVIALIVFGPQKLPEIGRQVGSAMRELQRVRQDVQRALDIDDYTRLDLPHYEPPSYGTTYAAGDYSSTGALMDDEPQDEYPRYGEIASAADDAGFVAPPGPKRLAEAVSPEMPSEHQKEL